MLRKHKRSNIAVLLIMRYSGWENQKPGFFAYKLFIGVMELSFQKPGFFANHNEWNPYRQISPMIKIISDIQRNLVFVSCLFVYHYGLKLRRFALP